MHLTCDMWLTCRHVFDMQTCIWHVGIRLTCGHVFYMYTFVTCVGISHSHMFVAGLSFGFVTILFFLAESSYSPEIKFPHNVLTRLEAVMGIQIVSLLTEHHSKLTSSSGVELEPHVNDYRYEKALPDPNTEPAKYVEEVIFQWSVGHSCRCPTWRQLLTVLQDIGLVDLSQQIQEFMKGKNHYFPQLL